MAEAKTYRMPFTRVELCVLSIVEGGLAVLLAKRSGDPFKGKWALPGGVLRIDLDRDLEGAAHRVAHERLSLELPYLRQQCTVGSADRDPRAPWAMSVVYRALASLNNLLPESGKRIEALQWRPVEAAIADSSLAFDHHKLVDVAVSSLRKEVDRLDIPYEFMPPQFTLGDLQDTCEALLGHRLDKSSFRRRLDDKGDIEPVPGELRRGPNRPAQMYRLSEG